MSNKIKKKKSNVIVYETYKQEREMTKTKLWYIAQ